MRPRTRRTLLRLLHGATGACIAAAVYFPPGWAEPFRLALAVAGVPLAAITGLWMWFGPAVLRRFRRSPRRVTSTAS